MSNQAWVIAVIRHIYKEYLELQHLSDTIDK